MTDMTSWNTRHQRVGLDEVGKYTVSTVKLPMDHGWGKVPLWYETMIFGPKDYEDLYMERYTTEEEALAGHLRAVEHAKQLDQETT